jgi:8-oxo-dGTP pyrophosphatase MutT (NUDIX family)
MKSACVVVRRGGRFAAIESAKYGGGGCLPGGKCRRGESPAAAARREAMEEVGLPVSNLRLLLRCKVGPHDCHLYVADAPPGARLRSSPEGRAVWVSRRRLAAGVFAEQTARWLPMLDARDARRAARGNER